MCEKNDNYVILVSVYDDYRKGLDIARKALIRLSEIRPSKDWEVWAIRQDLAPIHNVKIKNLGFLTGDNLKFALICADIYLLPSRSEGLSILLLQALACQCVVIGTEAANIITDELSGLVSTIDDWQAIAENLNRVMRDRNLFLKLRRNGHALTQKYSLLNNCARFETALSGFLNKK